MTEAQIKHMVDRFLSWKLPERFRPDNGISFEPVGNRGTPHEYRREPSGTNLLDYTQAEAMVRHLVEGLPSDALRPVDDADLERASIDYGIATVDLGLGDDPNETMRHVLNKFIQHRRAGPTRPEPSLEN